MSEFTLAIASALWLGILTSISPCPLATNLAALSFVTVRINNPRRVLLAGILYTIGRAVAYVALAALIVTSLLAIPDVAFYLELYGNRVLGPALIVVGALLLGLLRIPVPGSTLPQRVGHRAEKWGPAGAFLLGGAFALSFCPVSAALYFGSLMPLLVERGSPVLLPTFYGMGTSIPVLVCAILATTGVKLAGRITERLGRVEIWARHITATVFVGVGLYFVLNYNFEIFD